MNLKFIILAFILAIVLCSCFERKNDPIIRNNSGIESNDSTLYGLACDGTNDSIIIILPYDLSHPQTYSIIEAFRKHCIYGFPKVGDHIAVLLSKDRKSAECVINIERLCGKWYRNVLPNWHKPAAMTDQQFSRMKTHLLTVMSNSTQDSLFHPIEYMLELSSNGTVNTLENHPIKTNEDDAKIQLIEYPKMKHYTSWKLYNGKLIFSNDRRGHISDTCSFRITRKDSLIINFNDGTKIYYQKSEPSPENADINRGTRQHK